MIYEFVKQLTEKNLLDQTEELDLHNLYNLVYRAHDNISGINNHYNKEKLEYYKHMGVFMGYLTEELAVTNKGKKLLQGDFLSELVADLQYSDVGKILCPFNKVYNLLDIPVGKIALPFNYLGLHDLSNIDKSKINKIFSNWIEEYREIIKNR